jgi:predicted dehydrogenase
MNIAIIGIGYWGPNLVRNFIAQNKIKSLTACDVSTSKLVQIKEKFPSIKTENDPDKVFADTSIDAVVIATPVDTHYELAKKALKNNKHVWLEKPVSSHTSEVKTLIELSEKFNKVVMVDHTFVYTGAVQKMKELIDDNELGDLYYFDSVRANLGLFQRDINVLWDLAPHDLSILHYLINRKVLSVSAHGLAKFNGKENIAYLTLYLENDTIAHFTSNWTSPVKIRRTIIGGTKKMLLYDDMKTDEKIRIYDKGVEVIQNKEEYGLYNPLQFEYRSGDMYSPNVHLKEALGEAAKEFISSIEQNRTPLTSLKDGLFVVEVLEAAEKSIKNKGKLIELK